TGAETSSDLSSANLLPPGTVLFSSRASLGKVGIASVPLATNQGFANFIPRPGVDLARRRSKKSARLRCGDFASPSSSNSAASVGEPLAEADRESREKEELDAADHVEGCADPGGMNRVQELVERPHEHHEENAQPQGEKRLRYPSLFIHRFTLPARLPSPAADGRGRSAARRPPDRWWAARRGDSRTRSPSPCRRAPPCPRRAARAPRGPPHPPRRPGCGSARNARAAP